MIKISNGMNKNLIIAGLAGSVVLIIFFFSQANMQAPENKSGALSVVASFYPLYFISSEIGADIAGVRNITPAGEEPHEYEPTSGDIVAINNSALLVLNGEIEPWASDIIKNINSQQTFTITAGDGLITETMVHEGEAEADPHIWLDPMLAAKMADNILKGFLKVDPSNEAHYIGSANKLKDRFYALDAKFKSELADCRTRNIITSHAAFAYLAKAYGLRQVAISGLSTESEPSAKELAEVAKFAKDNNIKYIFFESLVSPKLAETIASEVGAQTLVLNPLEGLTQHEIERGDDYINVMEANLANLRIALECK